MKSVPIPCAPAGPAEFEERFAKRLPCERNTPSQGLLAYRVRSARQVIHVYPYDLHQRTAVRAALAPRHRAASSSRRGDLIVAQESEIMNPAPFMPPSAAGTTAPGT